LFDVVLDRCGGCGSGRHVCSPGTFVWLERRRATQQRL
jgi:hypothetical protein